MKNVSEMGYEDEGMGYEDEGMGYEDEGMGYEDEGMMEQLPQLAQLIAEQGEDGDVILAHINPNEAAMLAQLSGGGSINPVTGLPQFGFLGSIGNFLSGPIGSILTGGIGNLVGSALGGGKSQNNSRGHFAGGGFGGQGEQGKPLGVLGSLINNTGSSAAGAMGGMGGMGGIGRMLLEGFNKPKRKTPTDYAHESKEYDRGLRLNPKELADQEKYWLAEAQAKRRVARNKFLPEERIADLKPMFSKRNTPAEQRKTGNWIDYYDNPEFTGNSVPR